MWTTWIDRDNRLSAKKWARDYLPPESRDVVVTATTDAGEVINPIRSLFNRLGFIGNKNPRSKLREIYPKSD